MKCTIVAISDSDKHFKDMVSEYQKRLGKDCEIIDIKPSRQSTPQLTIEKDSLLLLEWIDNRRKKNYDGKVILLSKAGSKITTEDIVKTIKSQNVCFIIGGPYGLDEELFPLEKRSFGNITMPHGLAKVVLIEQLYRARSVLDGKSYHY